MRRITRTLLILCLPLALHAQRVDRLQPISPPLSASFSLPSPDSTFTLDYVFILPGSELIILDSTRTLSRGTDYQFDYSAGTIALSPRLRQELMAHGKHHSIVVRFDLLPFSIPRESFLHRPVFFKDSTGILKGRVESPARLSTLEDVFGPGIQKSGSIFRGLTVGSNRDLTLNSGFRMQLSGKLTSDLEVAAALTDENVPIQPEGTTQTLQELDNVFIQLKNPRFGATLGDFVYEIGGAEAGEFGKLSRKVQGAVGTANIQNALGGGKIGFSLVAAAARGKFTTNQFQGSDGVQGPYRLTGEDVSRQPIVIAGTERVYVDGQMMTRGEVNDYIIDYSTGEIYFSARRLITHASRITVDFEYTDRQFTRNLVGASAELVSSGGGLSLSMAFTREADDPSSPVDVSLPDSLRRIIAGAGDQRLAASIGGIQFAGRDSVTLAPKGQYILQDTLLGGIRKPLLVYAPGDPRSLYSAQFSFVDPMPVDSLGYVRIATGGFSVAGLGKGNYLPIQLLPIPESHSVAHGNVSYTPSKDLTVSAEYALSNFDRNRLSPLGEANSQGGAYKLNAQFHPTGVVLGGVRLGDIDLILSNRYVDRRFVSLDRSNEIEFARNWNLEGLAGGDETIREAVLALRPVPAIRVSAQYGLLERLGSVRSSRSRIEAALADSSMPDIAASSEVLETEDQISSSRSTWTRQMGSLKYGLGVIEPGISVSAEDRTDQFDVSDSLRQGSFRYLQVAPSMVLLKTDPVTLSAEVQFRGEDSAATGTLSRAFNSVTQLYDFHLREFSSLSGMLSLALRRTVFSDLYAARGNASANTMLMRSQMRYAPWKRALDADLLYEFSRERSAAMRRVFVRVPAGTGNYRYIGDTNGNGLADENEFEQTRFDGDYIVIYVPGSQLVPVADLKTGIRLRFSPSRLMTTKKSPLEKFLSSISTETVARIEENSTVADAKDIYLLHLSRFQNDSTTISGTSLFTQDVYLFESDPAFSMRWRFNERRGLQTLVGSTERAYVRERSVRVRSQLIREIGNQTEFTNKRDRLLTSVDSPRLRDLSSNEIKTEFSYRPYPEWEVAFGVGLSRVVNRIASEDATADLNNQFARLTYAFLGIGQLRGELQREEASVSGRTSVNPSEYPYEFTNGRAIGKTILWQLAFDYRISQYIQITVNYDGRSEGGRSAVHTGRAEARAFF